MGVTVFSSINDLPDDDQAALSYMAQGNLFRSVEWFSCLVDQGVAARENVRIYRAADDNGAGCFLFCVGDTQKGELASLGNFYTMEFAPVFTGEAPQKENLLADIFSYVADERPKWKYLNFKPVYDDSDLAAFASAHASRHGFFSNRYFMFENYFENLGGRDFPAYYDSRPSRVKNTIKRREKKLLKNHEQEILIFREFDDQAMADYDRVYANSWKEPEQFPNFMSGMARVASDMGALRIGVLRADGQPVAAQFWLLSGGKAIIYKLAYDEAFKEYSVGSILTREMLSHVLENDQVDEIDYGVGSEGYKKDWMDVTRTLVGCELFNRRTFAGKMMMYRCRMGLIAKKLGLLKHAAGG